MSDDPVNPKHYDGRACADIGERLSANGYQILKYCWRLGQKDAEVIELGKAEWYGLSELELLKRMEPIYPNLHTQPFAADLADPTGFLAERIEGRPLFTRAIAQLLWRGYNMQELEGIIAVIKLEAQNYEGS